MIDLTPLDVRNKRGDFDKALRGYDPQEVDTFMELVAERLEELVMENLRLRERTEGLQKQVESQSGRERAVQEALVTAQELRSDMKAQAERESELILNEARTEARRLLVEAEAHVRTVVRDAEGRLDEGKQALEELERRRTRFIRAFRQLLERELDVCEVEENREPLEIEPVDLELGGGRRKKPSTPEADATGRDPLPDGVDPGPFPDQGPDEEVEPEAVVATGTKPPAADPAEDPITAVADEVRDILAGLEREETPPEDGWVPGREERGPRAEDGSLRFSFDDSTPDSDDASDPPSDDPVPGADDR